MNRANFQRLSSFGYPRRVASGRQCAGAVAIAIKCNNRGSITATVNQLNTFPRAGLLPALCSLLSSTMVIAAPLPLSKTEARLKFGE